MENVTKNQIKSAVRDINAKAASWGQVCKQLSGIRGKVALDKGTSISVHEAFCLLGVHTQTNTYKPADIQLAWSEGLKEGQSMHTDTPFTDNSWRCPLIAKNRPVVVAIGGKDYKLATLVNGQIKAVSELRLCRVVKAEDRRKESDDVVVSAKVVLTGLMQSVYVHDTLADVAASQKEVAKLEKGYINEGNSTMPKWVAVEKTANGWAKVTDNK